MQTCSVLVALRGDLTMTVRKDDVTVPEIAILMNSHGHEAVVEIADTRGERQVQHAKERERLISNYGPEPYEAVFGKGFNIQFPTRLADLNWANSEPADDGEPEGEDTGEVSTPAPAVAGGGGGGGSASAANPKQASPTPAKK